MNTANRNESYNKYRNSVYAYTHTQNENNLITINSSTVLNEINKFTFIYLRHCQNKIVFKPRNYCCI